MKFVFGFSRRSAGLSPSGPFAAGAFRAGPDNGKELVWTMFSGVSRIRASGSRCAPLTAGRDRSGLLSGTSDSRNAAETPNAIIVVNSANVLRDRDDSAATKRV